MVYLDPRPNFSVSLESLLASLITDLPAFNGIEHNRIIVVYSSAYGLVAASIRPLGVCAKSIEIKGHRKNIELSLRPKFFFEGSPIRRLVTILHELLHIDQQNPHQLLVKHKHQNISQKALDKLAVKQATLWLQLKKFKLLAPLGHNGEVLIRQWKHMPVENTSTRIFSDKDIFLSPMIMKTKRNKRTVWW